MARKRPDGWWYPWIYVGGMLLVIVVNGLLIFYAVHTFTGLTTDHTYRKGLAYNDAIAGAKAQEEMGWHVALRFTPDGTGHGGAVEVSFRDHDGRAVPGLRVEARYVRPTHQGYDGRVALDDRGDGRYGGHLPLPLPGQWNLRLHALGQGVAYQYNRKIQAP